MLRKPFPTLIESMETLTQEDYFNAPELSALIALDASLFATIKLLELQNYTSYFGIHKAKPAGVEEHIADSICDLAKALRKNLSAYGAAMQQAEEDRMRPEEISF